MQLLKWATVAAAVLVAAPALKLGFFLAALGLGVSCCSWALAAMRSFTLKAVRHYGTWDESGAPSAPHD